jgi:hypothetical protein
VLVTGRGIQRLETRLLERDQRVDAQRIFGVRVVDDDREVMTREFEVRVELAAARVPRGEARIAQHRFARARAQDDVAPVRGDFGSQRAAHRLHQDQRLERVVRRRAQHCESLAEPALVRRVPLDDRAAPVHELAVGHLARGIGDRLEPIPAAPRAQRETELALAHRGVVAPVQTAVRQRAAELVRGRHGADGHGRFSRERGRGRDDEAEKRRDPRHRTHAERHADERTKRTRDRTDRLHAPVS